MAGELISREALERIIQHAAELQAGEHDIGDGLSRAELLALGKEVGIPERYLLQALLEEETHTVVESARGVLPWLTGPESVTAARVVPGDRPAVERALAGWLEHEELLQVKRRFADVTTWEPRAGAFASLQRAIGVGGKKYALARAGEIAVSITPLESGFCQVRLRADVGHQRRQRVAGATGLVGAGVVVAVVLGPVLGALAIWPYVPAAALWMAAVRYTRRHQDENGRIHLGLEQVLDRLERGDLRYGGRPASPAVLALGRIADELKRTLDF